MPTYSSIPDNDPVHIRPAANKRDIEGRGAYLKVRNPATNKHLPEDGETVKMSTYWRRALRDGDVVMVPQSSRTRRRTSTTEAEG